MLFTIIVIVVVAALVVYVTKKTKSTSPTALHAEDAIVTPSIHEEITKTVKEAKAQAPIANEVSKTSKVKSAPKMSTKSAKKSATKNKQ